MKRIVLSLLLAGLLTGCKIENVSMLIDNNNDTALTLVRTKDYFWSSGWQLDMVVRNNPDCQRRHRLKPMGEGALKVEIFSPEPMVYIFRQGKRWYVTTLKTCDLQQFKEEPPVPGNPVGSFVAKNGDLSFVAADAGEK
jgi:hypothetical protein